MAGRGRARTAVDGLARGCPCLDVRETLTTFARGRRILCVAPNPRSGRKVQPKSDGGVWTGTLEFVRRHKSWRQGRAGDFLPAGTPQQRRDGGRETERLAKVGLAHLGDAGAEESAAEAEATVVRGDGEGAQQAERTTGLVADATDKRALLDQDPRGLQVLRHAGRRQFGRRKEGLDRGEICGGGAAQHRLCKRALGHDPLPFQGRKTRRDCRRGGAGPSAAPRAIGVFPVRKRTGVNATASIQGDWPSSVMAADF